MTTYSGNEGEEKAQRTYNCHLYSSEAADVTAFEYPLTDDLEKSTTFRSDNTTSAIEYVLLGDKRSVPPYAGNEDTDKAHVQ